MPLLENITYSPGEPMQTAFDKTNDVIDVTNNVLGAGTTGQMLRKTSGVDFAVEWVPMAKQKVIEIGAWNMQTTEIVNIAHGLPYLKIIGIRVLIIQDGLSLRTALNNYDAFGSGQVSGQFGSTSINIDLYRNPSGQFNNANYNDTGINRGYIIIDYID